jgi:hypothetical protein
MLAARGGIPLKNDTQLQVMRAQRGLREWIDSPAATSDIINEHFSSVSGKMAS